MYAFRAHYLGDAGNASFMPSDGPCEPLRVVAANILIAANGVDRVGRTQTLSAHVVVNDGSGFANAPAGTQIDFKIEAGPGSISAPSITVGATGACQVGLQSAVGGATTVSAHTTLAVRGISLQRETDNLGGNAPPVVKQWIDARIAVGPSGIGLVGTPRTLTVTLEKDVGTGAFAPAAGEHVDVALTSSSGAAAVVNAAASTCDDAGPNTDAAGRCALVFTSPTEGAVTGHAVATLSVSGSPDFTVTSGDVVQTFDATPPVITVPGNVVAEASGPAGRSSRTPRRQPTTPTRPRFRTASRCRARCFRSARRR